jgi:hypothetical protein
VHLLHFSDLEAASTLNSGGRLYEAIDVLADQAPILHDALRWAASERLPHLIMDGKIFRHRLMPPQDDPSKESQ